MLCLKVASDGGGHSDKENPVKVSGSVLEELAAEEATLVHDNPGSCASHCSLHSPRGAEVVDNAIFIHCFIYIY